MKWLSSKQGVLAAVLSLLLVALLAAVTMKNESLAESELRVSTAMKPLYEYRRRSGAFGYEFEYRTGYTLIPGYERRRVVGRVFVSRFGPFRRPLTQFQIPGSQNRKISPATSLYKQNVGIAGYVRYYSADGFVPLVEMRKYNRFMRRYEFIYVQPRTAVYSARYRAGYRYTRRVGYMRPVTTLPLFRFNRYATNLGVYLNQYRVGSESVPYYTRRNQIGTLFNDHIDGRIALKQFSMASNTNIRRFSLDSGGRAYPKYLGVAGYCVATQRRPDLVPLIGMRKYFPKLRRYVYHYVTNKVQFEYQKRQGFTQFNRLCFVKKA